MTTPLLRGAALSCAALSILASQVCGQWSSNPGLNLAIADRASEQVQVKLAPTADGGAYVSWFDNAAGGYDVYLQRLDPAGIEQWAHNGVLVADRSFSSTQDYGLDVDAAGHALLAFRDDRSGSEQITAARIAPDGTLAWGTSGVQLTSGVAFHAAPKIAGTSDGHIVVAWTREDTVQLQKLDASGAPQWSPLITLSDPGTGSFSLADLHGSDGGAVIASWVRLGPQFYDPKHIWAQKFAADGSTLWAPAHVKVFDGGSLQFGNFPPFISDGSGGAVFAWYGVSPLQCYAQRVLANGTEAFAHNGVAVSTLASQIRVSPSASFHPATEETFLFWVEQNGAQSQHGVYGQKLSPLGVRQWSASGKVIVPVASIPRTQVRNLQTADGAVAFFVEAVALGNDRVYAARLDGAGNFVWPSELVAAGTFPSDKSRLAAARSAAGDAILAWTDSRNDAGDVYAQSLAPDGTLGNCTGFEADFDCNGVVDLVDFGAWEACLTGPAGGIDPGCDAKDLDDDDDVDLADYARFVLLFVAF